MSAISSPYGLKVLQLIGGQRFSGGTIREILMTTNSATGIFFGDLVNVTAGQPTAIAATPTTAIGVTTPVGVCVGITYVDPVLKQLQFAQFLPANAISAGYLNVKVRVMDDPDALFQVQAAGTIPLSALGTNAPLTNFGLGSTITGNSKVQLGTPAATATLAVRIVGFVDGPGSVPGDAFTDVIVKLNQGVHAYLNPTGQ